MVPHASTPLFGPLRLLLALVAAAALVVGLGGCGRQDDPEGVEAFDERGHEDKDHAREVHDLIQDLRFYESIDDPKAEARYFAAQDKLISKGTRIQGQLIEALNGHERWGVRLGCINVLNAVGDRDCVDDLINALRDDHPLVAHKAMVLLRVLCQHRVVAREGEGGEELLPAVPTRQPDEPIDHDEELWTRWYLTHGDELYRRWNTWWAANKLTTTIE